MAFLEPIDEAIQLRLFQKMRILSREGNSPNATVNVDDLSHDKMATRSTFIRMTSGLSEPVILMGGELLETADESFNIIRSTRGGYDEIYGARPYISYNTEDNFAILGDNKFKRPMPGIKSVEAQFLGGDKALRQATVNWTCWTFEDIDRLTPHFLSVGKTVCVEWGWVYGNDNLKNVRGFIGPNGIRRTAYENNRQVINEAKGDIDMAIGIVKNFEFNTRADGGFDCTTTLSSIGTDFIKKPIPDKGATNMTLRLNLRKDATAEDLKKKLESENEDIAPSDVTLKSVIEFLDDFLFEQIKSENQKPSSKDPSFNYEGTNFKLKNDAFYKSVPGYKKERYNYRIAWKHDSFLLNLVGKSVEHEAWVRWGWFEDNILSKFETVIGDKGIIKSQIRSVDNILDKRTKKVIGYKSVKIKDHSDFETVNPKKYILPGKFFPLTSAAFKEVAEEEGNQKFKEIYDQGEWGDADILQRLAAVVNDSENFKPFNSVDEEDNRLDRGDLRNMLIHVDVIKQAFGVGKGSRVQSLSTYEALKRMFNILNEDIGFWNFQLQSDDVETFRVKIVDGFTTEKPIPENPSKTTFNSSLSRSTYLKEFNIVGNNGVFFFPVWQHNSIVKDQNVSCTIPNEIAISVMYGANAPKINTQGATENEANDEGAQAAGGMGRQEGDGGDLEGLQLAFHHPFYQKYGIDSQLQYNPKGLQARQDNIDISIKDYFTEEQIKELVDKMPKEQRKDRNQQIVSAAASRLSTFLDKDTDKSLPPPLPKHLGPDQIKELLSDNLVGDAVVREGDEGYFKASAAFGLNRDFTKFYSSKFDDDFRMKQGFIDNIVYNTTYSTKRVRTKTSELDKPILLPISLELSIDGIGGILPFQSFHSTYLPKRYQKEALFQIFSVNHTVDSSQWTTTISGKMRSTLKNVYKTELKEVEKASIIDQFNSAKKISDIEQLKRQIQNTAGIENSLVPIQKQEIAGVYNAFVDINTGLERTDAGGAEDDDGDGIPNLIDPDYQG